MTGGAPDVRDIRAPLLLAASAPMILGPTMHLGAWFVVVAVLTLLLAAWVVLRRAPLAVPAVAARRLERSVFLLLTVVGLLGAIALVPSRLDAAGRWALVAAVGASGVALVVAAWTERRRLMLAAGIGYVAALALSAHLAVVHLDVLTFHDGAARALLHGISPYGITYPNPFDARETQAFYGSGLATPDRILVGYPYPPASLLLVLPGYLLGDTRFAMVAAVAVTSLVLHRYVSRAAVAPTWLASAAPVLLLLMPGMVYVVRNGWTEPLVLVLLALTVVGARRGWRATPYLLGAFLVTKQYSVLLLPLLWLLVPTARRSAGGVRGFSVRTVLTGLVLSLPLAALDPAGFWRSIVAFQFEQPFRRDSFSLAAVLSRWTSWPVESVAGVLSLVAALVLATVVAARAPRTPEAFSAAVGVTLFVAFLLSKQAFANYYFLAVGAVLVAIAAGFGSGVGDTAAEAAPVGRPGHRK